MFIQFMPASILKSRLSLVWLILIVITSASWLFGKEMDIHDVSYSSMAIIALTFIKARLVILDFMELRHALKWMRLAAKIWCIAVATGLCSLLWWHP